MTRWTVALVALALIPASAEAQAFASCRDARNYGANTGALYTAQVFSRIACDATRLARAHESIARVLASQVLRTSDSDAVKLCFYEGLFDGVTARLASEYARCGGCDAFACLEPLALVDDAAAVVRALGQALAVPASFDGSAVDALFPAASASEVTWCDVPETAQCEDELRARSDAVTLARYGALFGAIAERLCPAPLDAGTGEDAGVSEDAGASEDAGMSEDAGSDEIDGGAPTAP